MKKLYTIKPLVWMDYEDDRLISMAKTDHADYTISKVESGSFRCHYDTERKGCWLKGEGTVDEVKKVAQKHFEEYVKKQYLVEEKKP